MASNERKIVNNLNERARFYGRPADEVITIYDARAVLAFGNHKCVAIDCPTPDKPANSLDHRKSLVDGGANIVENLDPMHTNCNKRKGGKSSETTGAVCTKEYAKAFYPENRAKAKHNPLLVSDQHNKTEEKPKPRRYISPEFHGKPGRSGRRSRSHEAAMLQAFNQGCSPEEFGDMTQQLKRMFYDAATVQDEEGNILRLAVDAGTRVRIWEKFAAYGMGEPTKRVETGKIGELQEYLEDLMGTNGETLGDTGTGSNDIQASWIQTPSLN